VGEWVCVYVRVRVRVYLHCQFLNLIRLNASSNAFSALTDLKKAADLANRSGDQVIAAALYRQVLSVCVFCVLD